MRPDWLKAAADAIRRNDRRNVLAGAIAGLGAALAIGGMEWLSVASQYPLVIIPFATSIVLVIGSPEAEPAQPRALIGGHIVATLVGLAMLRLTGAGCLGGGGCGRIGCCRDVCHRHISPAGRDQSPAGGLQQPALVIPVRTGAGGRGAADGVCLALAQRDPSPAVAAALGVARQATAAGVMTPWRPRFCPAA